MRVKRNLDDLHGPDGQEMFAVVPVRLDISDNWFELPCSSHYQTRKRGQRSTTLQQTWRGRSRAPALFTNLRSRLLSLVPTTSKLHGVVPATMAMDKSLPPDIYDSQNPPIPRPRTPLTRSGERFRVTTSSTHQSRRITRKSAMPLAFDDKHLKKLLDHYCTAEQLGLWVESAPVVAILKYWVKSTLQCHEHDDTYRSLLLPAESEEKWSDFEEDCVHVAFTRIKREDLGLPAPDPPTSAWAYAIEQLVRESWRDDISGPLNGGQKPAQFKMSGWPCERACDLLHTVYESLRSEPNSGYFANLLGAFTGQRHLPLPVQFRPQLAPKSACETCRFNHIACDRTEPMCGQCKHRSVLCIKASGVSSDNINGDDEAPSYPFDPLFDESPPRSEPLMELVARLAPSTPTPQSNFSFYPRVEPAAATRPRLLDFTSVEPALATRGELTPLPSTPACRTCRNKHRGCDRARPSCGECSSRSVDCVWNKAMKKPSKEPSGASSTVLEEGEIDETIDVDESPPQSSVTKRGINSADQPSSKRPRLSGSTLMEALLSSVPRAIETKAINRAPTAPMMAPMPILTKHPNALGKVHSDRLAQIGKSSPPKSTTMDQQNVDIILFQPEVSGSNSIKVSATRASSVKAETKEVPNGFAKPQTRTAAPQFPAHSTTPFSGPVQHGVRLSKKQRKQLVGGSFLPRNQRNRPNLTTPAVVPASSGLTRSSEEARLSSALQYCKTLFDDIIAGRDVPNAAQMGVTAIQYALGNN